MPLPASVFANAAWAALLPAFGTAKPTSDSGVFSASEPVELDGAQAASIATIALIATAAMSRVRGRFMFCLVVRARQGACSSDLKYSISID